MPSFPLLEDRSAAASRYSRKPEARISRLRGNDVQRQIRYQKFSEWAMYIRPYNNRLQAESDFSTVGSLFVLRPSENMLSDGLFVVLPVVGRIRVCAPAW